MRLMSNSQKRNVNRAALALIAVSFAGALGAAAPAAATPNYDGLWSVVIVTEKGPPSWRPSPEYSIVDSGRPESARVGRPSDNPTAP